ncbi:zinc-dependent alcohol dehydrogenase [Peredibacter starrii]|uniref:Zinc-dependent alcohol dehydrogenase n=1 Tax=Peredibacter starrii TaxID=28202 RepID=A0AAX4HJ32_9BACT|nr:zinc-dependent alcohol dehydrogenase [Peredibacter starrii]WPU63237.1 zinc-dependent alcohol dehydrogenase [Peredibacter starrii]
MKALVFHRPKKVTLDTVPDPIIEKNNDIILKVTSTAICGSDLHIYNGLIPQVRPMVMGHEFMGVVEEVGKDIKHLKRGDRVVVPFPIACGQCFFCEHQLSTHCENSNSNYGPEGGLLREKGAALFGYTDLYGGYSGGQAEYVRVPFANFGPRKIDQSLTDDQVLFLTDIFPTGWSAVDWADLKGGETVAVFGCGPVGVMAMKAAWLKGAKRVIGIDHLPYRMEVAQKSAKAEVINFKEHDPAEIIREMTGGRGADVVIDAVGMEADRTLFDKAAQFVHLEAGTLNALKMAVRAVRRGGVVSVVGVYGTTYDNFPWGQIFDKGLRLVGGQAPVHKYIDELLGLVRDKKVFLDDIISHRLPLDKISEAYHIFNNKEDKCMKVVLKPHG